MPRTLQEIINHADEIADRLESSDEAGREITGDWLERLRAAVVARGEAEREIREAVDKARAEQVPWNVIGMMLGTTGEAARQRYGHRQFA